MFSHRSERRRSTTSSTNCNDAVLAAFIDTIVDIENHSLSNFEGVLHPSITNGDPSNTKTEQDDDIGKCILLQRVYFSEEKDRMQQKLPLSEVGSISFEGETIYSRTVTSASCKQSVPCLWESEDTSTHSVHCVTPEVPFVCASNYEQISTESFLREKNSESMKCNSEGQKYYTEPNETENACDLEANDLVTYNEDEYGDVTWSNHFTAFDQVTGGNGTPPFCLPRRRPYHPKICRHPLSDHCLPNTITNPCSDSQLQNGSGQTVEEVRSEAWNKNIKKANAKPLSETWQSTCYKQNENRIRSHSGYDLSGPLQTVSPKPVPCVQVQPSNVAFGEDQGFAPIFTRASSDYGVIGPKNHTSEYHTQNIVAAEPTPVGWHAHWQARETDKSLKSLHPICERSEHETGCKWPLEVYNGHQAYVENQYYAERASSLYVENGRNVSGGIRRVLPKSHVGFAKERYNCGATITGTDDSFTSLREPQYGQASSQINSSHPLTDEESLVRESLWQEESLASVPACSPRNFLVSQHGLSDLEERPSSNRLTKHDNTTKASIRPRQGEVSSSEENHNSEIEERSSKEQEGDAHLQSSQGSVQRNATPTPPNAGLPAHETKEEPATSFSQKAYKCDFPGCSKEYHRGSHLTCHQRLHTGERPYRCPWKNCAMTFRRSDERLRHFRVHTREKPYQCPLCSQRFFRSDHRKTHLRSKHNTNTMPS